MRKVLASDNIGVVLLGHWLLDGRVELLFLSSFNCRIFFLLFPFGFFLMAAAVFLAVCINFERFGSKIYFVFVNY
jgi:hypothetical protein